MQIDDYSPSPGASNTQRSIILLHEELANLPESDFVQVDTEWVQRFHTMLDIAQRAIVMGAVLTEISLPGRAIGAPMSYEAGGRQFIALTVRGARGGPPELVALALP